MHEAEPGFQPKKTFLKRIIKIFDSNAVEKKIFHTDRERELKKKEAARKKRLEENHWNPYFFENYDFDLDGTHTLEYSRKEWMLTGPKTLTLFKVISIDDLPAVIQGGVKSIDQLSQEGTLPKRQWITGPELAAGDGTYNYWTLGKVDIFYGGSEGKVLLMLDEPEMLQGDGVIYRKMDPAKTWDLGSVEKNSADSLSLDSLPENYWSDWWRSYEVLFPQAIAAGKFKVCPLDTTSKQQMDTLGISYTLPSVKYPVTEYWGPCSCGNPDSPYGEHVNEGYCG